ncbi:Uncharacterised protein [Serratia fonticola]|uniref:Uncharacterized protein n=1 Tax=Serratia fonticola TaxID=47917 RepID=A0A3S4XB24_SERFO|nr:Uncharacterised protein [Serratia fonticola]VEI69481.1 Uncharacterised protein [Serratia fonticola]
MLDFLQQLLLVPEFWVFMTELTKVANKLIKSPN